MTAIASTDVIVTITSRERSGKQVKVLGTIAFGDGSLTYPSGGVPLPAKSYFRLSSISRMNLTGDSASGYVFKYDYANHKITVFNTNTHAHDFLVKGGTAAASTDALNIKTAIVGKEAATDATALGADSATKGGVLAAAAGAMAALGTAITPAAITLYFEAYGKA
jgi:hypothetical protein